MQVFSQTLSPLGVPASRLTVGGLYFVVSYLDEECIIPIVDSLIFLGRNLEGHSEKALYFQDAASHRESGPYPNAHNETATVTVVDSDSDLPPNLFELEGVLDELARCAQRKKHKSG